MVKICPNCDSNQHKLVKFHTHKLFDILKQYQKEVNELRAERMAKNANPLALVATTQTLQDPYYQTSKPHKSYAPTHKLSLQPDLMQLQDTRQRDSKPITPASESAFGRRQWKKNVDTTLRYKNDNLTGQFRNQRAVNVVGARETIEQSDWLADMDEEIDEQELEAHYSYMAKIQEVPNADSGTLDVDENKKDSKSIKEGNATLTQELTECKSILAETSRTLGESNSIRDSCLVALQNKQTEFERFKAFNDHTVDCDKLERRLNETLGLLAQKEIDIKESLKVKGSMNFSCQEKHYELVKHSLLTKSHTKVLSKRNTKEHEQYFEIQDLKAQLQDKNIAISELKKLIEKCKGKYVDTKFDKPSVVRQPNAQRIPKPSVLGKPAPFSDSLERKYFAKKKSVLKTNESEGMYRIASSTTQTRAPQLNQTSRNTNPRVSTSTGVAHKTNVSRPQPRSNQMKDKVVPNTSHVKFKKTEVEEHPRISSISNQTKSVTACNDSLNSRTSNVNAVCANFGKMHV
ncbi:hypothetical protein Tco_1016724 [Tanacetum coccineum]|uniref:Uncharacterized protein n=1 Tax=Tanacetum coccineum TaxID=301880 RepID=A0ABQ5FQ30_9ASTR